MNFCLTHAADGARGRSRKSLALTLLEMMVAITLLAVIMIGLLAMFNQTQKALHIANAQTDVFESARGAIQIISRDLTEMTLYPDTNVFSSFANAWPSPIDRLPLPGGDVPVDFSDAFWLTRMNDNWQGVGYFVLDDIVNRTNYGVGTLYRFSGNVREPFVPQLFKAFTRVQPTNTHRVSDGIVHFTLEAVFITNSLSWTNFVRTNTFWRGDVLPAFVDVELGVLEPQTLKQFQALKDFDVGTAQRFLTNHAAQIHFFRERVPIRNFINPHRSNEVP
jgi:hypothetical protein